MNYSKIDPRESFNKTKFALGSLFIGLIGFKVRKIGLSTFLRLIN